MMTVMKSKLLMNKLIRTYNCNSIKVDELVINVYEEGIIIELINGNPIDVRLLTYLLIRDNDIALSIREYNRASIKGKLLETYVTPNKIDRGVVNLKIGNDYASTSFNIIEDERGRQVSPNSLNNLLVFPKSLWKVIFKEFIYGLDLFSPHVLVRNRCGNRYYVDPSDSVTYISERGLTKVEKRLTTDLIEKYGTLNMIVDAFYFIPARNQNYKCHFNISDSHAGYNINYGLDKYTLKVIIMNCNPSFDINKCFKLIDKSFVNINPLTCKKSIRSEATKNKTMIEYK